MAYFIHKDPRYNRGSFFMDHPAMAEVSEGIQWLSQDDLSAAKAVTMMQDDDPESLWPGSAACFNTAWRSEAQWKEAEKKEHFFLAQPGERKRRINLLALGSVGETVLMGLKLLGGDCLSEIGIFDVNENVVKRFEAEMNQTGYPFEPDRLPQVKAVSMEELFDCDVFVFCAAASVPPVGSGVLDVRMAQFEANSKIVAIYGKMAREKKFQGLFAVVSDPVDLLCKKAFLVSNQGDDGSFDGKGLLPEQIRGYGLGVMNARAAYYARQDDRFSSFLTEGRAFGPHGQDLVIANSIEHYDDGLSVELTELAAAANLRTRDLGFKPYIAPALSSAAISLILTIEGKWHYSAVFMGGVFMGCKNRETAEGVQVEHLSLEPQLRDRLEKAYKKLEAVL